MTDITRSFTSGQYSITVHRAKVRDRIRRDSLIGRLQRLELGDTESRFMFARAAAQSEVSGAEWLNAAPTDEELARVFEAWLDLDAALYDTWEKQLSQVNAAPGDPDLLPPGEMSDDAKKKPPTSASTGKPTPKP